MELALGTMPMRWVDRVLILDTCESTQDEAAQRAGGRPGLLVATVRQTAGRGRLGRVWTHHPALGLALTIALPSDLDPARLSIAAGLAAARAGSDLSGVMLGLRWPNDVVAHGPGPRWAKVAGILAERRGSLNLLGIGVNLNHAADDFPPEIRPHATSLRQLSGREAAHAEACISILKRLDESLALDPPSLSSSWGALSVLTGTRQRFIHDNHAYEGSVVSLDPAGSITLAMDDGSVASLPALTTSLVKDP
jgi:BirA family biotin operon repressor/biotin-[acetyl-CoA-carboxylase] ligase